MSEGSAETYTIKTQAFEGPFELLLTLIEKRKFFINDISLSEVTRDYLSYIGQKETFSFVHISEFISIASTLILLKARSLLPNLSLSEEEEKDVAELEIRLRAYQLIRKLSQSLQKMKRGTIRTGVDRLQATVFFSPGNTLSTSLLQQTFNEMLSRAPVVEEPKPETTIIKTMSIEEILSALVDRIEKAVETSFSSFVRREDYGAKEQKIHTIVSFLAILELVRQGILDANQQKNDGDITITKQHATI